MNAAGRALCLVVLGCGLSACDKPAQREQSCTLMACFDGLLIDVYPKAGWPAGNYQFVIKHDQETTSCTGRIPLQPCEQSQGSRCNSSTVVMSASGCALPPSNHYFAEIAFHSHPKVVNIEVFRDGTLLTRTHWDIAYSKFWPNGRECGTVCLGPTTPTDLTLPAVP